MYRLSVGRSTGPKVLPGNVLVAEILFDYHDDDDDDNDDDHDKDDDGDNVDNDDDDETMMTMVTPASQNRRIVLLEPHTHSQGHCSTPGL